MARPEISIILPARNEAASLRNLLPQLRRLYSDAEIIVVDDGSEDETYFVSKENNVNVIRNPYSKGNGAAIKAGARVARGKILVFMDADGQHLPEDIEKLLVKLEDGFDMAVGMRDKTAQASFGRRIANQFYNLFASFITGHRIYDLTSGFRAVKSRHFRHFLYLLPNGFSYPSSITMAFFRAGHSVVYVPVSVSPREGKSHLRPLRDGLRFLIIIFRVGTLYSPLKVFIPASAFFLIAGISYYAYTYHVMSRFTNMSALLFIVSALIILVGLVSEQVTTLMYSNTDENENISESDDSR